MVAQDNASQKSIKIIKVPPGFAPEKIRKGWVGIVIPLATQEQLENNPLSGISIGNQNTGGHVVLIQDAISALWAAGRYESYDFWRQYEDLTYLSFRKDVCEVIE